VHHGVGAESAQRDRDLRSIAQIDLRERRADGRVAVPFDRLSITSTW
jgi:hypothetical protein